MNHKYTKKQIIESIKYWKNVLKMLSESKSVLLDAFAEKFGEDIVFGNNGHERINASLDIAKNIYSIVNNSNIFDVHLTPRLFKVTGIIENFKLASYVVFSIKENERITFAKTTFRGKDNVVAYPPSFEISELAFKLKMPFIYFASIIVHEMIHQYVIEHKNGLQIREDILKREETYDSHKGEFKFMMDKINEEHGLSIRPYVNLENLQSEFNQAINSVKQMQESVNEENVIFKNDGMTIEKTADENINIVHMY